MYNPQRELPNQPALDEGNVPGTPSTKGLEIIIAAFLIGAVFLYLGTSLAPSNSAPSAPVTTPGSAR
jgi:hypothetical protein